MLVVMILIFIVFSGMARAARKRKENLKKLEEFNPPNIHGRRDFANEKSLKKGNLI
jgi:hypothetical protein